MIRKYAWVALIGGGIMLVLEAIGFCLADDVAREGARMYAALQAEQPDWDSWVFQVRAASTIGMLGYAAAIVASLGLFREREWGRKCWLAVVSVLVVYHGVWWLFDRSDWLTPAILIGIALPSWMDFTKAEKRTLFT